ncbi:MAG: cytochrome c biogenesis protein ResB [Microbacteriaceae bacterium]
MSRPSDHYDSAPARPAGPEQVKLSFTGWLRWFWRQLTSMRTALFLLLLLAIAAVPGSLVPQRGADPNGVTQFFEANPKLAPILDSFQLFDVYTSVWFSAIYLLLFASLIGCVIPRTAHHLRALRAKPPKTPIRLNRMAGYTTRTIAAAEPLSPRRGSAQAARAQAGTDASGAAIESARAMLRKLRYRVAIFTHPDGVSVSAERGYLRETGNLVFHIALLGILFAVGFGSGFGYDGQRVVVEGQTFVNALVNYDTFNPGRFVKGGNTLAPYSIGVQKLDVDYETQNKHAVGQPLDYTAHVTTRQGNDASVQKATIKVNEPLSIGGSQVYLLGNGVAPTITVRNAKGTVVFHDSVPFVPQDSNLTSLGVVKVPDGLSSQIGMIGFFYPTKHELPNKTFTSSFPGFNDPMLSLNVYSGDLGLDAGVPRSVYSLDISTMTQLTGGKTAVKPIELVPGATAALPNGMGTISLDGVKRYVSLSVHHDPTIGWVLFFSVCIVAGLLTSLFVPRRRVWVKVAAQADGSLLVEYAGLARGDDPGLDAAVAAIADEHAAQCGAVQHDDAAQQDDSDLEIHPVSEKIPEKKET